MFSFVVDERVKSRTAVRADALRSSSLSVCVNRQYCVLCMCQEYRYKQHGSSYDVLCV